MEEKEIYVESVADYLNALPENEEFSDSLLDHLTLFRGQGNKEWNLIPSVMRNREDFLNEELYIKECIRQYPEEFKNMNKVDILIKMQHYGMPTRLLDLTKNPLVALYFACVSEPNNDGVVYTTCGPVFRSSDLYINVITECVFNHKSHGDMYIGKDGLKIGKEYLSDVEIKKIIGYETPIIFEASLTNDRIKNQNGYFAIYRGENEWKEINYQHRIFIRKEFKEKIINQLSMIGIDSKFIFPELSNGVLSIVSSVKRRNLEFNKKFHTPFD
ncbi:FRG domain-containing protein [Erysipelatoclostridium sp. An173]|uniref:FRG domain-containing protein n=1 Tax=Erysipelatoclostridium sp. An173 TaxID=1965571 RepID=UPI003208816B